MIFSTVVRRWEPFRGEKVKVQLMRLFIRDVSVLLLDEPSNDIDIATLTLLEKP